MVKIEINKKTEKLVRSIGRMGESYDEVIYRGFSYLNGSSEFYNQE